MARPEKEVWWEDTDGVLRGPIMCVEAYLLDTDTIFMEDRDGNSLHVSSMVWKTLWVKAPPAKVAAISRKTHSRT